MRAQKDPTFFWDTFNIFPPPVPPQVEKKLESAPPDQAKKQCPFSSGKSSSLSSASNGEAARAAEVLGSGEDDKKQN